MKINLRFLSVLSALFVLGILVSSVGAAGDLSSNGIDSKNFAVDVPSGSDFSKEATTNLNVGGVSMNMEVFDNKGNNANDVSAIMYLKDSSSNQNIISDVIDDLRKEGAIVEENDKYFIVETKNSNWDFLNFDIGDDIESLWNFATGIFSSGDGNDINVVDNENNTVKISEKGLFVSDANGEDVSISTEGIKLTDNSGSGEASADADISIDADVASNIENSDYALCIKNPKVDQVIVLTGNDLDTLKSMADTASFK